jgi:hypothetical protein
MPDRRQDAVFCVPRPARRGGGCLQPDVFRVVILRPAYGPKNLGVLDRLCAEILRCAQNDNTPNTYPQPVARGHSLPLPAEVYED